MKAKNVPEHHVRGVLRTLNVAGGDEMNHPRCSVGSCKNGIESIAISRHFGETGDPVHADRLPFPRGEVGGNLVLRDGLVLRAGTCGIRDKLLHVVECVRKCHQIKCLPGTLMSAKEYRCGTE